MTITDERKLARELEGGRLASLLLLTGPEPYLLALWRRRIEERLVEPGLRELNLQRYDADETLPARLALDSELLPVMAERRLISVGDFAPDAQLDEAGVKTLLSVLEALPEGVCVLLSTGNIPADSKKSAKLRRVRKLCEDKGLVLELPTRPRPALIAFCTKRCSERGAALTPAAASLLLETVAPDMNTLAGECEKLAAAAGEGREITPEIVQEVAAPTSQAGIFTLSTAIFDGNTAKALLIGKRLLDQREPLTLILGILAKALLEAVRARAGLDAGLGRDQLRTQLDFSRDFLLDNALRTAKRFPPERLSRAAELLLEADILAKTTAVEDYSHLQGIVVSLTHALHGKTASAGRG